MKVCYFGDYDINYSRNSVIIGGLKQNGVDVVCVNCKPERPDKYKYLISELRKLNGSYDLLIVGFGTSRLTVLIAKIFGTGPLVWDAFISVYETYVFDRKYLSKWSLRAAYHFFWDWFNCVLADKVLLDTKEHIRYFVTTFGVSELKFIKVWVGTDDTIFCP